MQQQKSLIMSIFLAISVLFLTACAQIPDDSRFPTTTDDNVQQLKTSSELTAFLKQQQEASKNSYGGGFGLARDTLESSGPQPAAQKQSADMGARSTDGQQRYSQTNVQVKGVDEADIVKNDGKYIYTLTQNKLVIVDAYPPTTATITATIDLPGNARDLFINKNYVVVLTDLYQDIYYGKDVAILPAEGQGIAEKMSILPPERYSTPKTGVYIYDTKNKEAPKLVANYTVEGSYYQSRMIGDYVYVIAQHPSYYYGGPVPMPAIESNTEIVATSPVYYFDNYEPQLNFNSIASFNIFDPDDVQLRSYLLGYANTLYVSQQAIYLAYQKQLPYRYYEQQAFNLWNELVMPALPSDVQKTMQRILDSGYDNSIKQQKLSETLEQYFNKLSPAESQRAQQLLEEKMMRWSEEQQAEQMKTIIHKLSLDQGDIDYVTKGEVKGTLLNQFSLDEYDEHLRVATTATFYLNRGQKMYNIVSVLDEDLDVVGLLENIAPEERIYAARFMGERLYLVTFKQVDPFFVIDLSNVQKPKILGALKIPGFSQYLHPYDENHILGIGQDTVEEQGRTMMGGLKIALFDVSDVQNPKERAKLIIGGRGTSTPVAYDHKAFLFDADKKLVIFPVHEVKDANWQHVWQGVYVLHVKPDIGFAVRGKITHGTYDPTKYYDTFSTQVQRSLYIGDILYTISPKKIKMNDLDDLQIEHKTITLPYKEYEYPPIVY